MGMDLSSEFCRVGVDASDNDVTIRVQGEIDLATATLLHAAFDAVDGQGHIDVDVSEMTFCDGTGLRALERARQRFGPRLRVTGATPMLQRLAGIVDMDWLAADEAQRRPASGNPAA